MIAAIRFRALGTFFTLLVLAGCASQEARPPTPVELADVTSHALSEAIFLQTIVQSCSSLGGHTADSAQRIYENWLERNWKWVALSDQYFSDEIKARVFTFDNHEIALPALKFLTEQRRYALIKVGANKRSRANRRNSCEKKLAPYNLPENDLATAPNVIVVLETLAQKYGAMPPEVYRVPQLAGNLTPLTEPGRTLYTVERSLHQQDCSDPKLVTFQNEWPIEVYGAFCSNEKQLLIACQWGKCKTQQ